jgi:hypothetical protein
MLLAILINIIRSIDELIFISLIDILQQMLDVLCDIGIAVKVIEVTPLLIWRINADLVDVQIILVILLHPVALLLNFILGFS